MAKIKDILQKLLFWATNNPIILRLKNFVFDMKLPGFSGMTNQEVFVFFIKGIKKGAIGTRAAASTYKFFMALFPGVIFLLTLIPYIPIKNFHHKLLISIEGIIPSEIYPFIEKTLIDTVVNKKSGILSLGILFTLYFSTNGMNGLMQAFNASAFISETRKPLKQRLVAIYFTFFMVFMMMFIVAFMTFVGWIKNHFKHELLDITVAFINVGQWLVIFSAIYFAIATIFYYAPARTMRWSYFSAGAFSSTIIVILASLGISFYITYFNTYNKVYGILGTVPVILIWINLIVYSLLIGFELNVSIRYADKYKRREMLQN